MFEVYNKELCYRNSQMTLTLIIVILQWNSRVRLFLYCRISLIQIQRMSKIQACDYLGVSRATFDNYVRDGFIPKGIKQEGFKELSLE